MTSAQARPNLPRKVGVTFPGDTYESSFKKLNPIQQPKSPKHVLVQKLEWDCRMAYVIGREGGMKCVGRLAGGESMMLF